MSNKAAVKYSSEFKEEALKMALELGTTKTALQLGVPVGTVNNWKMKFGATGSNFSSKKNLFDLEEENRRLKKELTQQKKITELLKKTTAIISQDLF
jgi:transposase